MQNLRKTGLSLRQHRAKPAYVIPRISHMLGISNEICGIGNRFVSVENLEHAVFPFTTRSLRGYVRKAQHEIVKKPNIKPGVLGDVSSTPLPRGATAMSGLHLKDSGTTSHDTARKVRITQSEISLRGVELARDDTHSGVLQRMLKGNNRAIKDLILRTIIPGFHELAVHRIGNYVISGCINMDIALNEPDLSKAQNQLHTLIANRSIELALDKFGSHVLQVCLAKGTETQRALLLKQLLDPTGDNLAHVDEVLSKKGGRKSPSDSLLLLACDEHANYVLQKIFENKSTEACQLVQAFAASRAMELALNKFGTHFLKKCLDNGTEEERNIILKQLIDPTGDNLSHLDKILSKKGGRKSELDSLLLLASNPFGSHLLHKIFESESTEFHQLLHAFAASRAIELALNQFGNRFIRRCLEKGTEEQQLFILKQLIQPTGDNLAHLDKVLSRRVEDRSGSNSLLLLASDQNMTKLLQSILDSELLEAVQLIQASAASRALELALNQFGNRFLRRCLEKGTQEQQISIVKQLIQPSGDNLAHLDKVLSRRVEDRSDSDSLVLLASNQFGVHLLPKILVSESKAVRELVQAWATSTAIELALNKSGSHILQKCLNKGTEEQQLSIVKQLIQPTGRNLAHLDKVLNSRVEDRSELDSLVLLASNQFAVHLVPKIVVSESTAVRELVQGIAAARAIELALNKYGNRFLQSCLDKGTEEHRTSIVKQLIHPTGDNLAYLGKVLEQDNTVEIKPVPLMVLSSDEYGSYVVQSSLHTGREEEKNEIFEFLTSNLVELSKHKHGHHVLKYSLHNIERAKLTRILDQLVNPTENMNKGVGEETIVMNLASHTYGFSVMQRVIEETIGEERRLLLSQIPPTEGSLRDALLGGITLEDP